RDGPARAARRPRPSCAPPPRRRRARPRRGRRGRRAARARARTRRRPPRAPRRRPPRRARRAGDTPSRGARGSSPSRATRSGRPRGRERGAARRRSGRSRREASRRRSLQRKRPFGVIRRAFLRTRESRARSRLRRNPWVLLYVPSRWSSTRANVSLLLLALLLRRSLLLRPALLLRLLGLLLRSHVYLLWESRSVRFPSSPRRESPPPHSTTLGSIRGQMRRSQEKIGVLENIF